MILFAVNANDFTEKVGHRQSQLSLNYDTKHISLPTDILQAPNFKNRELGIHVTKRDLEIGSFLLCCVQRPIL